MWSSSEKEHAGPDDRAHFLEKAKLSIVHTNHCMRATAIQRIVNARLPATAIIATTRHKQVQSPASYATRNSDTRKSKMASILDMQPVPQTMPSPLASTAHPCSAVSLPFDGSSEICQDNEVTELTQSGSHHTLNAGTSFSFIASKSR